jgi:hypothetical protein
MRDRARWERWRRPAAHQISRPATPSRAGAQGLRTHQPLDAMQAE